MTHALRDWQTFYVLTGGTAGSLAGLLFVAMQFGVSRGVRYPAGLESALATFVTPTFTRYVEVLLIAIVVLFPAKTGPLLGVLLLLLTPVNAWSLYGVLRRSFGEYPSGVLKADYWVWNVTLPAIADLLLVVAGLALLLGLSWALVSLGVVTAILLLTALLNTWQVMTWLTQREIAQREVMIPSDDASGGEPTRRRPGG